MYIKRELLKSFNHYFSVSENGAITNQTIQTLNILQPCERASLNVRSHADKLFFRSNKTFDPQLLFSALSL